MGETAPQQTLIGQTIGNYEVIEKLGEGGMGAVYLAQHPRIGKRVALKVLHSEFASDTNIVDRFFTEAKSVNDIGHPNIVDIIDYGEFKGEDGKQNVYFFMEFLKGESIADLIARDAPVDPQRAFLIAAQIADALGASHRQKVVHRDLKPDNVFLIKRGRIQEFVKVLDFGIAKLTGDQPGSRRTRTGIVIGTPYYMSPEQCEGKGNVDRRTDIYALGIVLYEMITGRVPFDGEGYGEILVQHLTQCPPRPSSLIPTMNPYVEVVLLKALERHRDNRYDTMEEFLAALQDPVGYVDARGGLTGFLTQQMMSGTPGGYAPVVGPQVTPVPRITPAPEDQSQPFAIGGAGRPDATPFPTPMGPQTEPPYDASLDAPPRSKTPLFIGLGVGALAIAVALALALGGGGGSGTEAAANEAGGDGAGATGASAGETGALVPDQPPEPRLVEIAVASKPVGAQVFVAGEDAPRGTTPTTFELDQGDEPVTLVLRKEGFEEENKVITPDRDANVDVSLSAIPKQVASDRRNKKRATTDRKKRRKPKKKRSKVGDDILVPDL